MKFKLLESRCWSEKCHYCIVKWKLRCSFWEIQRFAFKFVYWLCRKLCRTFLVLWNFCKKEIFFSAPVSKWRQTHSGSEVMLKQSCYSMRLLILTHDLIAVAKSACKFYLCFVNFRSLSPFISFQAIKKHMKIT